MRTETSISRPVAARRASGSRLPIAAEPTPVIFVLDAAEITFSATWTTWTTAPTTRQEPLTLGTTTASGVVEWLSNDPIGISGGLNQYVFCGNNPVNSRDPLGLCGDRGEYRVSSEIIDGRRYQTVNGIPYPFDPDYAETPGRWLREHILRDYRQDLYTHYWVSRYLSYYFGSRLTYRIGNAWEIFELWVYGQKVDDSDLAADWLGAYRLPVPRDMNNWEPYQRAPIPAGALPPPELPPRQVRGAKTVWVMFLELFTFGF